MSARALRHVVPGQGARGPGQGARLRSTQGGELAGGAAHAQDRLIAPELRRSPRRLHQRLAPQPIPTIEGGRGASVRPLQGVSAHRLLLSLEK